jgi:ribosomal protein S18 acetylase RimI-like enzyme
MITVRRIRPHEWPEYRALRLRALQDSPDAFGSTFDAERGRPDAVWAARVAEAAASGKDLALVAQSGDEWCGLAWCKVAADDSAVANLYQMWVAPERRGQGAGGRLLREAMAWAAAAGAKFLRLGVAEAESPALRLYVAHGFARVGAAYPLREGSPLKAVTMELALGAGASPAPPAPPAPHAPPAPPAPPAHAEHRRA